MTAAAMFRVAASRIEAGESYDSVLADYGWVTAATVDRLRAENDALHAALRAALREQREVVVAAPREER